MLWRASVMPNLDRRCTGTRCLIKPVSSIKAEGRRAFHSVLDMSRRTACNIREDISSTSASIRHGSSGWLRRQTQVIGWSRTESHNHPDTRLS